MKKYICLTLSAVLLASAVPYMAVAETKAPEVSTAVSLYGQAFSVEEDKALRSAVPDMFDGSAEDVKAALKIMGAAVDAQRTAYENALDALGEKLEKAGNLPAMFMRPDADGNISINFKDEIYLETRDGPLENRVGYIKAEIDFWITQGEWEKKVGYYNKLVKGKLPLLDLEAIASLVAKSQSYDAVRKLDLALRQSEEVQSQGLGEYGVVKPKPIPVDPEAVGNQVSPSWMGNASDGT